MKCTRGTMRQTPVTGHRPYPQYFWTHQEPLKVHCNIVQSDAACSRVASDHLDKLTLI